MSGFTKGGDDASAAARRPPPAAPRRALAAQGKVVVATPAGRGDEPDALPDVAGLRAPAGPLTVRAVEGDLEYRVVLTPMLDGGVQATARSRRGSASSTASGRPTHAAGHGPRPRSAG